LFSHEEINIDDMCETKSVTTSLYLDFNEGLSEDEHNYIFIGRVGRFSPVKPGSGGGLLMREKDGKYYAVTGTKGYRWLESENIKRDNMIDKIDTSYYENLVDAAIKDIRKYGNYDWFISDEPY
jgi:hypothetical protein